MFQISRTDPNFSLHYMHTNLPNKYYYFKSKLNPFRTHVLFLSNTATHY